VNQLTGRDTSRLLEVRCDLRSWFKGSGRSFLARRNVPLPGACLAEVLPQRIREETVAVFPPQFLRRNRS
jgi:hypothetical protein